MEEITNDLTRPAGEQGAIASFHFTTTLSLRRRVSAAVLSQHRMSDLRPATKGENSTQIGPDASAQSVWRDARLSRNVGQPNHVLANVIGGNKAEWWPRAGEEWFAVTKHDGVEVESILINKTKVG